MASAFKPTFLRPIPEGATPCKLRGKPAVKWTDKRGKVQTRRIHIRRSDGKPSGKMICEQRNWQMRYKLPDGTWKREKGYSDKQQTEYEAAQREAAARGVASGFHPVDPKHASTPITQHLEDYLEDRRRLGRAANATQVVTSTIGAVIKGCQWRTLADITADDMVAYLASLKTAGYSDRTMNGHLGHMRTFLGWCVRQKRLGADPLKNVSPIKVVRNVRDRRALTEDEVCRLLAAAATTCRGPRGLMGIRAQARRYYKEHPEMTYRALATMFNVSAPTIRDWLTNDRKGRCLHHRLVYIVALTTGLRRSELKKLQWRDVILDGDEPRLELRAEATKSRRADVVYLPDETTAELRAYRPDGVSPMDTVFPSIPSIRWLRETLKRADIPYIDASGRVADFHSLRYTFGTMLAKAGVHPRVAMEMMRQRDINLTMRLYTDLSILDRRGAVRSIPSFTKQAKTPAAATQGA